MKESYWGYWLVVLGIFVITVLLLIQNVTSQNTHDYYAVKEITQAAMIDAIDYAYMEEYGEVRINKEVFIESFLERFSQTASLNNTYKITFYDIYEVPPKVSLKVSSGSNSFKIFGDAEDFDIVNKIDAVLEVPTQFNEGSEAKAVCKNCIYVIDGVREIPVVTFPEYIPGSTTPGFYAPGTDGTTRYYDIVVEETESPKCKSVYAVFNKEDEAGTKVDALAYDIYTCRLYNKDGSPKKGCDVVLPIVGKTGANVYGWKIKGTTNVYAPGTTVTINANTVFIPVFDTNLLKANPTKTTDTNKNVCSGNTITGNFHTTTKDGKKVEGLKSIDKTTSSCCASDGGYCPEASGLYIAKPTVESGYTFKGWEYYENWNIGTISSKQAGTKIKIGANSKGVTYEFYPVIEKAGFESCAYDSSGKEINFNGTSGDTLNGMRGTPMVSTKLYKDATFNDKQALRTLQPGQIFMIRGSVSTKVSDAGEAWRVYFPDTNECGYIKSNFSAISLQDYLDDVAVINIFNTKSAQYKLKKNGKYENINDLTGEQLYSDEYNDFVPLTYSFAKSVKKAAELAQKEGRTLEINDAYTPYTATTYIYSKTKGQIAGSDIESQAGNYISASVNQHNTGCAVDVTIKGGSMPTQVHALSLDAKKYNNVCWNTTSSVCKNHIANNYNSTMTNDSKLLDSYFRKAVTLANSESYSVKTAISDSPVEWWHFQSDSCHSRIVAKSTKAASFWASSKTEKEATACLDDDIYVGEANMKNGDVTNATAWPQYTSVQLYDLNNNKAKIITSGTPMRVYSCDSTYCTVWVKGDDCSERYKIKGSQMLINLPDYLPDVYYGGHATEKSGKRRGLLLNKKTNSNKPIVPTRYVMAQKLAKASAAIKKKGYRLYINDLYRPVSSQSNPIKKSNPNCLYVSCGISYHAFAGAVDASLMEYNKSTKKWTKVTIKPKIGDGGSDAHVSSIKKSKYKKLYKVLSDAMTGAGLKVYEYEWWHFNDSSAISDRNTANNNKSEWASKTKIYGANGSRPKVYVFDLDKINKSSKYKHVDFLPKLYYED